MKQVLAGISGVPFSITLLALDIIGEVKDLRELAPVIELDGTIRDRVILKPHQVKVKDWRKGIEKNSFLSILKITTHHEIRKLGWVKRLPEDHNSQHRICYLHPVSLSFIISVHWWFPMDKEKV